jgi:hypothetical protein
MDQVSSVKISHGCPDVGSIIDQTGSEIVPEVSFRASVVRRRIWRLIRWIC